MVYDGQVYSDTAYKKDERSATIWIISMLAKMTSLLYSKWNDERFQYFNNILV